MKKSKKHVEMICNEIYKYLEIDFQNGTATIKSVKTIESLFKIDYNNKYYNGCLTDYGMLVDNKDNIILNENEEKIVENIIKKMDRKLKKVCNKL